MNHNLTKEIFEKHLKELLEEAKAMMTFVKQDRDELTNTQMFRLQQINYLSDMVYARKNAFDEMMRCDMAIMRTFDSLGIDMSNPPEVEEVH